MKSGTRDSGKGKRKAQRKGRKETQRSRRVQTNAPRCLNRAMEASPFFSATFLPLKRAF